MQVSRLCYFLWLWWEGLHFLKNIVEPNNRTSRPDMFCTKGVLRNFSKFTGKHLCHCLFFNKAATLLKKVWHRCFPVNFVKFLITPFFTDPHPPPFHLPDGCFCNNRSRKPTKIENDDSLFNSCNERIVELLSQTKKNIQNIIDIKNFSTLKKLLIITPWLLRFICNVKSKILARNQTWKII